MIQGNESPTPAMLPLFYILTSVAFYVIAYRSAKPFEESLATHPVKVCERIHLYPEETSARAA